MQKLRFYFLKYPSLATSVIYGFFAISWILLSDQLLFWFHESLNLQEKEMLIISKVKGVGFVLVSMLLLFGILKRLNRLKAENEYNFSRIFHQHPTPMWVYEANTLAILEVNKTAKLSYGYSAEEFRALTILDLRPRKEVPRLEKKLSEISQNQPSHSGIWLHEDKQERKFYVDIYSNPIEYRGKPCRVVTALDVHTKVVARQERESFAQALNQVASVAITDLEGNLLEVNDKFCEISGYSRDELLGRNQNIVSSRYHSESFWNSMWESIRAGKPWRGDIRNRKKDGRFYWVDAIVNPMRDATGKIYKIMTIKYEITRRKRLENEQKDLVEDLTEYTYLTSHKLRGPLARVLGLIKLINKTDSEVFRQELVAKLEVTSRELDEVIRAMNDALNRTAYDLIIEKREQEQDVN